MLLEKELQKMASDKARARVITINGYQMVGKILEADASAVVVEVGTTRTVVNTNAVSTVVATEG